MADHNIRPGIYVNVDRLCI